VHRLLLVYTAAIFSFGEIPNSVLAEPDLEKRSELALKVAEDSITAAAKAYAAAAEPSALQQHLTTVEEMTRLSLKSLQDTGKPASKKPKYFKRAELKIRSLLRRMNTLSDEVSADDRPLVEAAKKVMTETHDQLLHDIMSKR
jgi:hypothetical protein